MRIPQVARLGTAAISAAVSLAIALAATGIARCGENSQADGAKVHVTPRPSLGRRVTPSSAIRLDIKLVLVPVTVTDPYGAPVTGLPREAFRLYEDGVEQKLTYFASDDAPTSLGVIFDASKSMEGKLDKSRFAVSRIFRSAMPGDEFFLVEFNDTPRLLSAFTADTDQIEESLAAIRPRNWTSLFDAIYLGIHQMKYARHQRKALVILSDGVDNCSRYTEAEMRRLVREADVSIYSIGLAGGGFFRRHLRFLKRLSEDTGGLLIEVEKIAELPDAVAKINHAVRNQYLLGFSSNDARNNGLFRKIVVKLDQRPSGPPLRASWREGYYAPAEP